MTRISLIKSAGYDDLYDTKLSQVRSLLAAGYVPMLVNAVCCVAIMAVHIGSQEMSNDHAVEWAAVNLILLLMGVAFQITAERRLSQGDKPTGILVRFTLNAGAAGMVWAVLPYSMGPIDVGGAQSYVFLIMFGISAESLARGIPHAATAAAFAVPPIVSATLALGGASSAHPGYAVTASVVLAAIVIQACRRGEKTFVNEVRARNEASRLAHSLKAANADIQGNNRRLEVLANRDSLTGLANRERFNEELKADLRTHPKLALLIFDLNRFKAVNDNLGHAAGDRLLVEVGRRLVETIGDTGLIARLGGDEFGVIFRGMQAEETADAVALRLLETMQVPVMLTGKPFSLSAAIGIACYPNHGRTRAELFAFANTALSDAKQHSREKGAITIVTSELRARAERQRQIENDLHDALEKGHVNVWFQPQLRLTDRRLVGLEALVRWDHQGLGPVSPEEIVRAAEATHLLPLLTGTVAEHACWMINHLHANGLSDVTVAINVSPREFSSYSVADMITGITSRHGIDPASFEIEFTEETLLDADLFGDELRRLEQAGYKLTVDDFGMGHSSLTYLLSMRIDGLKIDRSFIQGLATSPQNQALVTAIVGLGHLMNIPVVVEGIEIESDIAILRLLGCQTGQGYAFGKPMPVEELLSWMGDRAEQTG